MGNEVFRSAAQSRLVRFGTTFLLVLAVFLLVEVMPLCWGPRAVPQEQLVDQVRGRVPRILLVGFAVSAFVSMGLRRRGGERDRSAEDGSGSGQ